MSFDKQNRESLSIPLTLPLSQPDNGSSKPGVKTPGYPHMPLCGVAGLAERGNEGSRGVQSPARGGRGDDSSCDKNFLNLMPLPTERGRKARLTTCFAPGDTQYLAAMTSADV